MNSTTALDTKSALHRCAARAASAARWAPDGPRERWQARVAQCARTWRARYRASPGSNLGQTLTELVEGNLQVLLVEELCVVQTGAHDALVAVDHALGVLGLAVGDDHELTRELALAVIDREVTLVGEHGLADDLVRDLEELLIEGTDEHRRPLAEVNDLLEDLLGRVDMTAGASGLDLGDAGKDGLATTLGRKHAGVLEHLLINSGAGNNMVARAKYAMTARGVAARHVGKRHGHNILAQKAADPADRTNKGRMLVTPALAAVVGPLQAGDGLLAQSGQNRRSRCGGNVLLGEHILATVSVLATDQVLGSHTALAGKALGAWWRYRQRRRQCWPRGHA